MKYLAIILTLFFALSCGNNIKEHQGTMCAVAYHEFSLSTKLVTPLESGYFYAVGIECQDDKMLTPVVVFANQDSLMCVGDNVTVRGKVLTTASYDYFDNGVKTKQRVEIWELTSFEIH